MFQLATLVILLSLLLQNSVIAERVQPHLHAEVKIVGYEGPLSREMFALFRNAEILEFLDCNFTSVPDRALTMLPKLKIFYLNNVHNAEVHPEVSKDIETLEEFYYIDGSWPKPSLEAWTHYTNLRKLVIKNHKQPFVELGDNVLNNKKLEYLQISRSGVEKIDNLAFNNLDKLEILKLHGNKLTTISKESLAPLKSLKNLDLRENLLTSFSSAQLPELPKLEKIDLSKNPLEKLSLSNIEQVAPNLKTLDLSDTKIPESELDVLTKDTKINIIRKATN